MPLTESVIEQAAIDWFTSLGYAYAYGKDIDPGSAHPERASFDQVILPARLRAALVRLNPSVTSVDEAKKRNYFEVNDEA